MQSAKVSNNTFRVFKSLSDLYRKLVSRKNETTVFRQTLYFETHVNAGPLFYKTDHLFCCQVWLRLLTYLLTYLLYYLFSVSKFSYGLLYYLGNTLLENRLRA